MYRLRIVRRGMSVVIDRNEGRDSRLERDVLSVSQVYQQLSERGDSVRQKNGKPPQIPDIGLSVKRAVPDAGKSEKGEETTK